MKVLIPVEDEVVETRKTISTYLPKGQQNMTHVKLKNHPYNKGRHWILESEVPGFPPNVWKKRTS
jgi:hypothetical protein